MESIKDRLIIPDYSIDSSIYSQDNLILDEYVCEVCGLRYELCCCSKEKE